jgi:phosphate:Na+ symporter
LEVAHSSVDAFAAAWPANPSISTHRSRQSGKSSISWNRFRWDHDLGTFESRLVRLAHALDHLTQLHDDLAQVPLAVSGWQPPAGFEAGALTLAAWLDTTKGPEAAPGPAIFEAMEYASKRLTDERKAARDETLKEVALQRTLAETARNSLEMLAWADGALYHAWRLAESLRIASGKYPTLSITRTS